MKITCQGFETEWQLSSPDNEGWMAATVFVKVRSFEGRFRCMIERQEWDALVQTLRRLESLIGNDAECAWANMEENVELAFSLQRSGALRCSYRFSPDTFTAGPVLSGSFAVDQSFLRTWLNAISEA